MYAKVFFGEVFLINHYGNYLMSYRFFYTLKCLNVTNMCLKIAERIKKKCSKLSRVIILLKKKMFVQGNKVAIYLFIGKYRVPHLKIKLDFRS